MAGPAPAVAAARSAVRALLAPLPPGPVLVACSGGADSLALAAATAFVAPRAGRPAGAVVVDHAWHPGSADVARRAAAACSALGLAPVEVLPAPDAVRSEASARAARYAALADAARRHGAAGVLLGHTLDDQAESVLLGLARGSGGRSLAGMAADTVLPTGCGDVRVLRPLLGLRRADTESACAALGLVPWHDPANTDPAHARSRLRAASDLLDDLLGPGLAEALARTADLLREDADALDAAARALLVRAGGGDAPDPADDLDDDLDRGLDGGLDGGLDRGLDGGLDLDVAVLAAAPDAVRRRALLLAARRAGCPAGALGRRHVLALDALVVAWRGQGTAHLPGRVEGRRACGRLSLARTPAPTTE